MNYWKVCSRLQRLRRPRLDGNEEDSAVDGTILVSVWTDMALQGIRTSVIHSRGDANRIDWITPVNRKTTRIGRE